MTNLTYRQWMTEVDAGVEKRVGLGLYDLPDWLSRDAYDAGLTVVQGVNACLEQVGFVVFESELLVDEA
jgi:hypothetical protein